MKCKIPIVLFLVAHLLALPASMQGSESADTLPSVIARLNGNNAFPREKVYLHLDNNAYFEGETLWFKAYVKRLSMRKPMSRLLYVELLDDGGETVHRLICPLDSAGQTEGSFSLDLPVRSGYHEVRAYTREMLNWEEGYYSRVVPVFKRVKEGDEGALNIDVPHYEADFPLGHKRPLMLESEKKVRLDFFPEGGERPRSLSQRIAFKLTDGRGAPLSDSLQVLAADGRTLFTVTPVTEGMGMFEAPTEATEVRVRGNRFPLPEARADVVLNVLPSFYTEELGNVVRAHVEASPEAQPATYYLMLSNRGYISRLVTLHLKGSEAADAQFEMGALFPGINSIDLVTEEGKTMASRLVWKDVPQDFTTKVRQNKLSYAPFEPVALEIESRPSTTFSLSVRSKDSEIFPDLSDDIARELLLSSEVKGYIAHPEQYLTAEASPMLIDLLLMVQGWQAHDWRALDLADTTRRIEPIETQMAIRGTAYHDNNRLNPYGGLSIDMQLYSPSGKALKGKCLTDSKGGFQFNAGRDFFGDYRAFFTTRGIDGKKKWSRLTFRHPEVPTPKAFDATAFDLTFLFPTVRDSLLTESPLFAWTDTIARYPGIQLGEAKVTDKGRYRGLTGGRYTYNGGPRAGMRRADLFIDIPRATERYKDKGLGEPTIWDVLAAELPDFSVRAIPEPSELDEYYTHSELTGVQDIGLKRKDDDKGGKEETTSLPATLRNVASVNYDMYYGGRRVLVFINNKLQCKSLVNGIGSLSDAMTENMMADDFQSAVVMTKQADWLPFVPPTVVNAGDQKAKMREYGLLEQEQSCNEIPFDRNNPQWYALFLYERPDWYSLKKSKGLDRRFIQGLHVPTAFRSPYYNGLDLPTPADNRRTLYWNPSVTTDAEGHASVVFFNDARDAQRLSISIKGITEDGDIINYER